MKSRLYRILILLSFCLPALPALAQMSDEQVVVYVQEGLSAGKSKMQLGNELLAQGVTRSQIERLRNRYETDGVPETDTLRQDDTAPSRTRMRDTPEESPDGSPAPTPASPQIFGHNVFSTPSLSFEPNENMATPENYRLGPGDELIIDIWGVNEDHIRQEISPEGNILISQIGPVYLNGLTIREANRELRRIFAQKYAGVSGENPASDIRVTLGQLRTIQINIMGEVATPGTYRLSSFSTVFHALYKAGGITPIGSLRNIRVIRGDREIATLDVYDYLFEGKLSDDIRLEEGDVILVPPYELLVDIRGNVKRPMFYEMKPGETLDTLVRYAGGFTGDAYTAEVRLIRETGWERLLFNIPDGEYAEFTLKNGDTAIVEATSDLFANRVTVQGAVYRPGMYELGNGMTTVRTLVERADGLRDDAFLTRAQLFRETDDLSSEVLAVDLEGVMTGRVPDIPLRKNDLLVVSNVHDLKESGAFVIGGEVARPGVYPYAENTTLEDLVIRAGGLLEGASTVKVDVSRRLKDPQSTESSTKIGETYTFALKDGFVVDGEPGFLLEPFDVVEVRRSPGYQPQRQVAITGEVLFPGGYTLIRKNERLSDLVKRAGGITSDAYARGGRLIRRMNDEERAMRETTLQMARQNRGVDSISISKLQLGDYYTVGIELDKALANPGSDYDMVMREGDRLVVPEYISTVKIHGNVMVPNTVLYIEGKRFKYYISQAGGYGKRAKRSKAYIVYMNGTVARAKGRKRIEPGCEIVVPSKRERERMPLAEILGLTTSIASVGTMAASIANMAK